MDTRGRISKIDLAERSSSLIHILAINDIEYTSEEAAFLLELINVAVEGRMQALAKLIIGRSMHVTHNYNMLASLAIRNNHPATEMMLEEPREPDLIQELLISAAKEASLTAVELILKKGVDPNVQDQAMATPLHWAAWSGNIVTMALLLKEGAKVDAKDTNMETPLHWAAKSDREPAIRMLLQARANINSQDQLWRTPLYEAARHGQKEAIKALLGSGAKIHLEDKSGLTPLDMARRSGDRESLDLLIHASSSVCS